MTKAKIKDLEARVNELKAQQREADDIRRKLEESQAHKDSLNSLARKDKAALKALANGFEAGNEVRSINPIDRRKRC